MSKNVMYLHHNDAHEEHIKPRPISTLTESHLLPPSSARNLDDNILTVDWDGPDDPENPRNWSFGKKWQATVIVSAFTFISPVFSMIASATRQLAERFDIHNTVILAMTTSVFVLGYGNNHCSLRVFVLAIPFGPLSLGPLSEMYGRSRVLQLANLWYLVWNLACGFASSKNMLIAFRFLAGLGGSAPLSIGGCVIGDLFDAEHRGQPIAICSLAPLLGPVVGPVAVAWVAEKSTWRWVVGLGLLFNTHFLVLTYIVLVDENARQKEIRIPTDITVRHWKVISGKALLRPFKLFMHETIMQLLGLYLAFIYRLLYLFLTTISTTFQDVYHDRVGIAGFHYLALGVGLSVSSQINAKLMDKIYTLLKARNGAGRPEFRLANIVPGSIFLPIGLLITGWTTQNHVFWLVPNIRIAFVGAGTMVTYFGIQAYLIDAFTLHAASALAAASFLRSLVGFGFPLFAPTMYNALGYSKSDTILAATAIALGCPAPWLL
ncbi:major facilitator superfamily domain-containing protein [Russula compacta]|nr:major facilitator superfamily domain-containing protein [Russula compacta]